MSELVSGLRSRYDTCGLSCRLATACPLLPPGTDAGRFGVTVVPVTDNAARRTIGDILLAHGFVSEESLAEAVAEQERSAQPLGQILVARGVITRLELASALAEQWSDPSASITSLARSAPVAAPTGQPHDDAQYAARLQDAVADLARRVQANQPLEGIDERIAELSQRVEATLARTQRIEATVATLAESLEGVTGGVEEAFGAVQAGTAELTGELRRIDEAVAELATRPVETHATDPAVWERLDELRGAVGELAERPVTDDAARSRVEELAARLEAAADGTDLDDLRSAVRELQARPSADPELAARLDHVEAVAAGSVGREEVEAQATILADLLATLTALESKPKGNAEIDARLGQIETSLSAVASGVDVEALAARVDETASAQRGLGASLDALGDRIEELSELQALQADAASRLDGLEERLAAEASAIVGLRDTMIASGERPDDGRTEALALTVEGLQEQLAALQQTPSSDPQLLERLETLADQVTQLSQATHDSQALALTVEGLQEQLAALQQTPSSDPQLLERLETLADQVTQLSQATHDSQALALAVEGLQEQLAALQQTPSSDPQLLERLETLADQVTQLSQATHDSQALALTVEGLQEQLAALQQTPSSDPQLLERLETLADQVTQLSQATHDSQALALAVEGLQEQLAALQQTPSSDPQLLERLETLADQVTQLSQATHDDQALARLHAIEERLAAGLVTRDELAAELGQVRDELVPPAPAPDGRIDALVEAVSSVQADLGERFDSKLAAIESRLDTDLDAMDVIAHAVDRLRDDLARVPESGAHTAAPTDEVVASLERRLQAVDELEARVQALAETIEAPARVPRAAGEELPDRLEQELERFRMALERITLHLGEHDRALVDIVRSGMTERLEELAAKVDAMAEGDVVSTSAAMPNVFGDVRALMARVEEAETASQADRDRLMTRLERMASSIDWRLQRLETEETPE